MSTTAEERNRTFALGAFGTLADRRDFVAAQRFWSPDYIQHRVVRLEDGLIAERWDVVQDEATAEEPKSRLPMFGDMFPTRACPEADPR
jgi:predicted SnoaL-like aldol condensation-catalyzing enzyme